MRYVVLGSSAAGINGIRELRRLDKTCEIVLISRDREIYSRCILHHYLSGTRDKEQLNFAEKDFDTLYRVNWMKGRTCMGVNAAERFVVLENGEQVSYDKLLIATGSHTYIPPIKNIEQAENVSGFRNIEDMEPLKKAAASAEHIVVMGAGLVGLDCVSGFLHLGRKPVMVEWMGWLLGKQLDERAADTYRKAFEQQGIRQYYGVGIAEVVVNDAHQITEIRLTDGRSLPCDYLVVTAGVRPNVEFLEGSGIALGPRGLLYDETGRTSDEHVYGAGDVSGMSPIWPAAVKEGIVAASSMAGVERRMTDFFASKATMNFLGIPSMSLGDVNPAEDQDNPVVIEKKETKNSYKKIVHKNGKITGAILQGDLAYGGILQQLIARKIDVTKVKKPIFDIDYSDFFHMDENFEFYYDEADKEA